MYKILYVPTSKFLCLDNIQCNFRTAALAQAYIEYIFFCTFSKSYCREEFEIVEIKDNDLVENNDEENNRRNKN